MGLNRNHFPFINNLILAQFMESRNQKKLPEYPLFESNVLQQALSDPSLIHFCSAAHLFFILDSNILFLAKDGRQNAAVWTYSGNKEKLKTRSININ